MKRKHKMSKSNYRSTTASRSIDVHKLKDVDMVTNHLIVLEIVRKT